MASNSANLGEGYGDDRCYGGRGTVRACGYGRRSSMAR